MRKHPPHQPSIRSITVLGATLSLILFLGACDPISIEGDPGDENTTVAELIETIESAWDQNRIESYTPLFTDEFTFYFDPTDGSTPNSWSLEDELTAAGGLFDTFTDEDVQLELIPPDDFTEPDDEATELHLDQVAYFLVVDDGEDLWRALGTADFDLVRRGDRWLIDIWYDHGETALAGIHETSWGHIKYHLGLLR